MDSYLHLHLRKGIPLFYLRIHNDLGFTSVQGFPVHIPDTVISVLTQVLLFVIFSFPD